MWFGKSIIAKLGFVVALAVPAFAGAPVKPFSFTYIGASNDALQQDEWNYLMKFKMFGTKGIEFGNESIRVTDSVGWFGTSKGSLKMGINGKDTVGGPILVGKDLSFYLGPDVFTTGPLYVAGDVSVLSEGFKDNKSTFAGDVCIGGTVAQYFRDKFVTDEEKSRLHIGSGCPDTVPVIKTNLEIPQNTATKYDKELDGANLKGAGDGSVYETFEIVVPATTDGSDTPYDVHIKSIRMENYSKILVKQPVGGRLTRLFIDDLDIATTKGRIVVAYEDSVVVGKYNELKNDEYLGTLLIYTSSNLKIKTMDKDYAYFQGSIISKGTIHIEQHLILAGQVLADSIYIDTDFDGKSFIYVPFGSPEIDPNLLKDGKWIEIDRDSLVPIFLDTLPGTDVKFSYCFDVKDGEADPKNDPSPVPRKAVLSDFKKTSKSKFPVCGKGESERVLIKAEHLEPTDETKIYIHVVNDTYDEGDEILVLKIFDLLGAVMPGKKKEGTFNLTITDVRPPHFDDDVKSYDVEENTKKGVEFATIPVDGVEIAADDIDLFKLIVGGTDATAAKTLFDFELVKLKNSTDPTIYDSAYVKMTVKTADLNYEALSQTSFKLTFSLENDGRTTDASDRTINVIDVNEKPGVDKNSSFSVKEEQSIGTEVGEVIATDPDSKNEAFRHLEYTIVSSTPVPFEIPVSTKGVIKTTEKLDYESLKDQDYKYTFDVKVSNCLKNATTGKYTEHCLADTAKITVKIQNVPEDPKINCFTDDTPQQCKESDVYENTAVGKLVHAFQITDPDKGQIASMTAELTDVKTGGVAATYFQAVTKGDSLKIVVKSGINYEALPKDTIFNVKLTITDADGKTATFNYRIDLVDVNEAPVFASNDTTISVKENTPNGSVVGKLPASDPDTLHVKKFGHLEYSIIDRVANNIPFDMDSNKIVVTNVKALDYEALQPTAKFTFKVLVANCELNQTTGKYDGACLYDTANVSLSVTDEPEKTIIIPPCEGPKCSECVGETCVEETEELCTENCDTPRDTTSTSVLTLSVKENSKTGFVIADYLVRDEDVGTGHKDTLVAALKNTNGSGADSLFVVNMKKDANGDWRLVVSVKDGSKLDYEKIKASHEVIISVKDPADPAGMGDELHRIIKVVDVNEAPKAKDADLKPDENLPKGTVIGKLDVTEPDSKHVKEFGHLEYSIIGKDDTFAFVMDSNKVKVNDPTKMDYELAVHKYVFDVLISNCELNQSTGKYDGACLYDTAKVTVDIQDLNEVPKIVIDGPDDPDGDDDSDPNCVAFCDTTSRGVTPTDTLTVGVKENPEDPNDGEKIIITPTGKILFQYHVVDEDTGHVAGAKVTWFDVGTTIPSLSTKGSDLFTIEYKNGVITAKVKDEKLLDYEALRNAKTRDDPDPEYTMGIVVTDPEGLADTLYRTIRVTDENEKPLFDVWPLVITENNKINDSLGHVEHPSDIDSLSRNPELYDNGFKMTGGDTELFWLDKDSTDLMRVMIRANVVLDCENGEYTCGVDSMYWVYMTYGDTTLKTVYSNLTIPVKLIDLDEAPEILTDTIGVDENSPKGTVVDTIKWFDVDRFDSVMTFKIVKDPTGCFEINSYTGVVKVKRDKCAGLDYEKNPTVKIDVSVTDMVDVPDSLYDENCKCQLISAKDGPITTIKTIEVNIHDVNEPPSISDKTIAVPESTTVWTVIDTVKATDPDKKKEYSTLIYTAVSGDTAVFMIDPHTGAVILKDTLDYESKKNYVVYVQVDDGEFTDTAKVKINVTNVIEKSEVVITKYDNVDSTWNYPDTVYTNKKNGTITWRQDDDIVSKDTVLKKGKNVIVITYKDPSKDLPGSDTVVIMFNDEVPVVEVSANPTHVKAENVFTIVEDMGDADTNIYVNKERDSVYVHVKDPANKRDTSFALEVNLEPVKVPDATFRKMNEIADSKLMLDETPTGPVTRSPVNGNSEKVSYTQLVGGDTVTVSYIVDKDGEPVKASVINSKGKTESVEIITVTYKTIVDDQEVEVSYIADALTGEILAKGPNGELMYQGASSKGSKPGKGKDSEKDSNVSEGIFSVTTVSIDGLGMPTVVSYAVDEKGNMVKNAEGDIGYAVTYTYKNIYGNFATESVFIVLDQTTPTVEILSPVTYSIIRSNFVEVKWTVNGVEQDSLTIQGLEKGPNIIVRFYRDKAGNEASDTVSVMMKDSKSVNIAVEQPVTEIDKDKVEEYYSVNPPKKGETFAVSIKNPSTGKEVETLIGGSFKTKEGSGEEPYPGMDKGHLGPTLALDIKLPVIVPKEGYGTVSGLATLDDIVVSDGTIPLEGVDADNATKISVEEYVEKYCEDGVKIPSDISEFNLYDSKLHAKIWVYTSLGNFVDYFNFKQDLNDPSFTDEAGVLNLYFEQKPDKNGFVKADNGKQYATGAYVYKVEATIRSKLRCTLPSSDFNAKKYRETGDGFGPSAKRKGDVIKNSDELLKSFGYRRPKH